ncbi:MAG: hypothetical protein JNL75_12290 [Chitinophagales bacterium]|nr:hypothetical protein [Chitinophagales bacterium]
MLKKELFKRLFYILVCIVPLYILADDKSSRRFIALGFFLIIIYQLITLVQLSPLIIDAFFPPKTYFEKKPTKFNKIIYPFSSFFCFVSVFLSIFEIRNIENTFLGTRFFWISGILGIVLAIIITLLILKLSPSTYHESKRRYTVNFGLFLGLFLLTPTISSFINHFFSKNEIQCRNFRIEKKSSGIRTYSIYVNTSSKKDECFKIKKPLFESISEGDTIEICSKLGFLGYEYAQEFNKTAQY